MTGIDLSIDTPDSKAWQDAQSARAEAHISQLPGYAGLTERLAEYLVDTRRAPLTRRGPRWFSTAVLDPAAESPVLVVRDTPAGEPRVLLDPNELSAKRGVPVTMLWSSPSPDGSIIACGVTAAGTEVCEVSLIDVATGAVLPEDVPWSVNHPVAWLPDGSGFWCNARDMVDGAFQMLIHRHELGEPAGDPIPVPDGLLFPAPKVSRDGRHVVLVTGNTEIRTEAIFTDGRFELLLEGVAGGVVGEIVGDDLVAIVDGDAPRGRLVRIPLATARDTSTWTSLVDESDDVLRYVGVVDATIVLGYLRDAACRLRLLDLEGRALAEVEVPGDGVVGTYATGAAHPALPMFTTGDDEISFIFSTFDAAPAVYRYVVSERRLEVTAPPAAQIDGLVVSSITARSADGAEVPAHVVHRADVDVTSPQPTLIYGYGGFNLTVLPFFLAEKAAWVEAGGVYVLAHLRGGSDLGAEWWQQGRRERKQNTFNDLYAVADHLIATGRTTPGQLAFKGESNGGLLAGAAIVQRPDLWAAVVADVPALDLLGMVRDPYTFAIGQFEYGDPNVPAEAEWLRAVSPVHNVRESAFPAVLVTAGENDPRCPAWHSRTFVDLVQRANTGDQPILLRVYGDQGHGAGGIGATAHKDADWLAFVANATGLAL